MRYSVWPPGSRANSDATPVEQSWEEFARWLAQPLDTDDKHAQGFSPLSQIQPGPGGRVAGGAASFLALEYDAEATPELLLRALDVLANHQVAAVIHTTASATTEQPRFRAILRPSRPIETDAEYRAAVTSFGRAVQCQPVDSQRTRLWYRPIRGCQVLVLEGPHDWEIPVVAPAPPPPAASTIPTTADPAGALAALLQRPGEVGAYQAACVCRDYGLDREAAEDLVRAWGRTRGWADLEGVPDRVQHAYTYAQRPAGALATLTQAPTTPAEVRTGTHVHNDAGNADRLLDNFGADLIHVDGLGWYRWDAPRWVPLAHGPIREAELCAEAVRLEGVRVGGDLGKTLQTWGQRSGDASRLWAAVRVAATRPTVATTAAELDADPWLLGLESGVLDLRTAEHRPATREDRITRICDVTYDPDAKCPRFDRFLREIMCGDLELVRYMLRFLGSGLTGSPASRALGVWWGPEGANGKSTLIRLLHRILGGYAHSLSIGVLTEVGGKRSSAAASPDLAALRGARLATCVETDAGMRWNESMIKTLTGGDHVTARQLYQEPITFEPSWTLVLATNHKPIVRGTDAAIWDRLQLLPFKARFDGAKAQPKESLDEELWAERSGILNRLLEGCVDWQRRGIGTPQAVADAVAHYREDQDVVGAFLSEYTQQGVSIKKSELYRYYKYWAEDNGQFLLGKQQFNRVLSERGIKDNELTTRHAAWLGITILK